jgi:hypothetical protein
MASALEHLRAAVDAVRDACSRDGSAEALATTLRAADDLTAAAVAMLANGSAGIEAEAGLPAELAVSLGARRTPWEARALVGCAETFRRMPCLAALVADATVSFSQARAICRAARDLDAAGCAALDALITRLAPRLADAEPDALVAAADDEVARLRADLARAREQRRIEGSFLMLQPRLSGGGAIYGEADTAAFATLAEAIDAAAARPGSAEDPDAPTRGAQRMEALVGICATALAGGSTGAAPRPRFIATCDIAELEAAGASEGARVLWRVAGRPGRLSPLATEVAACDAEVVPVVFDGARPIGVGDTRKGTPDKVRTALVARDGGCRFPGCQAPAGWSDSHHILNRDDGGDASVDNLVLLCRRCHTRVHGHRWRIRPKPDGSIAFSHRGKTYVSVSRVRPHRRE